MKVLLGRRPWERVRRWRWEGELLLGRLPEEILVDHGEEGSTTTSGTLLGGRVLQTWEEEEAPSSAVAAVGVDRGDGREDRKGTTALADSDQVQEELLLLRADWEALSSRRP